jgi:chromosomal replication initiation ATPase DnaA
MSEQEKEAIEVLVDRFRERLISAREQVQSEIISGDNPIDTFNRYLKATADYFHIPVETMRRNSSRKTEYRVARQIVFYFCKAGESRLPISLQKIGELMDDVKPFDHSTVLHGRKTIAIDVVFDPELRYNVESIAKNLGFELIKSDKDYTITRI